MKKRKAVNEQQVGSSLGIETPVVKRKKSLREPDQRVEEDQQEFSKEKRGKKRRRKARAEEDLAPEEKLRRQQQREYREKALQLRQEGKTYKRPPKKKLKTEHQGGKNGQAVRTAWGDEESGSRPSHPVQVIVIPIFWNRKPEEKEEVIAAAQEIEKLLASAGLQTGVDTTNAMSPGQKFAYWEGLNVKVRVECGPHDARKNSCVLAFSKKAGDVAERQSCQVGTQLLSSINKLQVLELHPKHSDVFKSEVVAAEPSGTGLGAGTKRLAHPSGDDIGGDFHELGSHDEGAQGRKRKKKKLA